MGFKKQNIFFRWLLFLIANSDKPNKNIVRGIEYKENFKTRFTEQGKVKLLWAIKTWNSFNKQKFKHLFGKGPPECFRKSHKLSSENQGQSETTDQTKKMWYLFHTLSKA